MSDYDKQLAAWKAKIRPDPPMEAEDRDSDLNSWCFGCDKQMPVSQMKLITRGTDAYVQIDESPGDYIAEENRVRMCPECFEEKYGES